MTRDENGGCAERGMSPNDRPTPRRRTPNGKPELNPKRASIMNTIALNESDPVYRLQRVQNAVWKWSQRNFGDNISKHTGHMLGSTAPVLGIMEEVGELWTAGSDAEKRDAVADVLVYLCDFCNRDSVDLATLWSAERVTASPFYLIATGLRWIAHSTLKRHQGIRDMHDEATYKAARDKGIKAIVAGLQAYCRQHVRDNPNPLTLLEETWAKVEKRDWTKNPENAHQGN